jgi:hypothetical protein
VPTNFLPKVQDVQFKTQRQLLHMNPFTHKETSIEFLHPNPVVAADALLEIGTTVI